MKALLLLLTLLVSQSCDSIGGSDVYICTGPQSKVYHKTSNCKGLRRCSRMIKKISLEEAKKLHRRECKLCY